jgi:DNA-binding beta-propeller fold protein YncE
MAAMKRRGLLFMFSAVLLSAAFTVQAAPYTLKIKVAPPEAELIADGSPVSPQGMEAYEGVRMYRFSDGLPAVLKITAPGYRDNLIRHPLMSGSAGGSAGGSEQSERIDIKLEPIESAMLLSGLQETGRQPKSVLFVENGSRIATALLDDRGIQVFDAGSLEVLAFSSPAGEDAEKRGFVEMVEIPGRKELWVSQMTTGKIHIFETGSYRWIESISAGGSWPKVLELDKAGKRVYVSLWNGFSVAEIDVESRKVLRRFPVSGIPRGLALSPDGTALYISNFSSGNIERVSLESGISTEIATGPGAMRHLVLNRSGSLLFFSDMYNGTVGAVDTAENRILWKKRLGSNVNTIVLDPRERYLYASIRGKNGSRGYLHEGDSFGTVYRIDARTGRVAGRVWGGDQPTGLDISPDGKMLVFSDFLDHRLELYRIEEDLP